MTTPAGPPPGGPPPGPPGGGAYQQPPQWQPPWPPPPPPPPAPKNRRGWLWGAGALAIAAVALGVTLFVVLRAGGSKDDTSSAEATVQSFLNAAKDGDRDAGMELITDELRDQVAEVDVYSDDSRLEDGEITDTSVDGDRATVRVAGKLSDGTDVDLEFEVTTEAGEWLISDLGVVQPASEGPGGFRS